MSVDSNTQAIITAINTGNDKQQKTLEAQQDSIQQLAMSVHELAMTTGFLQKNIDNNKTQLDKELVVVHNRIDKAQEESTKHNDVVTGELKEIIKTITADNVKVGSMWTVRQRAASLVVGIIIAGALAAYVLGKP